MSVVLSDSLNIIVSADGRVVPRNVYAGKQTTEFKCMEDFTCLLLYVEQLKLCKGCPAKKYPKISSSVVASKHGETWRRNTCTVLSVNATCAQCRTLEKLFLQRTKQQKDGKKKQAARLKLLRRKAIRATSRREKLKEEVILVKRKLSAITEETIDSSLHILPARQQLAFKTAFMAAKAKSKNGRRYDDEWLMTCLLLQISSPKAYTLLADMQLLPLPSKARLRQIIAGIPCKYGFNQVALNSVRSHFSNKSHLKRLGVLLLDEIKLKRGVSFNKASCRMDGFIDYGEVMAPNANHLADHALVLMFVPLFEDWVQPIASFATKGAAPGKVLAELVMSGILELHKNNASVLAVISDGAGNNRSMWSQLGVSGKMDATCHFIEHPWEPSQNIYFICDVPHIVKCIRNHLRKHTYGMAGDLRINFQHYVTLYETEKKKHVRVVPKLTEAHVSPDNLRKMSVRLATQLFSRGTSIGLRVYREANVPGLKDSEGTETFTRMLNDVFDALNVKLPCRGIRHHSKEIQTMKQFLEVLNVTEQNAVEKGTKLFASQLTTESLRVTLLSTLDIINYLFNKGALYVLTAKLNQDPLERHFGLARSFGGDESHPTVMNFSQIFRLLSLYTPIKTALRGSVQGEPNAVLLLVTSHGRWIKSGRALADENGGRSEGWPVAALDASAFLVQLAKSWLFSNFGIGP
ncbi:hypothetical protein HPB49_004155 [Dermacentor silvarum]|uniref:Uncharacterized protein n=1 Tax=Dermacentor silvarum TaxID=543639 RepID=A0ACB8DUE3_DERSI|nr:hypothetical protein HPB49_004155 [Dermacentor silvarum]